MLTRLSASPAASIAEPPLRATPVSLIETCLLPTAAVLARCRDDGSYTDCYRAEVDATVTLAQYVEAFYTSPVFRLERFILRWAIRRPSSDAEARQLARGEIDRFPAWTVEDRDRRQLLMRDVFGSTRSWLMVEPRGEGGGTWLYFGSAVVPTRRSVEQGRPSMGLQFRLLLSVHQLYSRVLLRAACRNLKARS